MKKLKERTPAKREVHEMLSPVVCAHCRKVYDLAHVTITSRYADATCYTTPCCRREADDREWKSLPDFRRVTPEEIAANGIVMRDNGTIERLW